MGNHPFFGALQQCKDERKAKESSLIEGQTTEVDIIYSQIEVKCNSSETLFDLSV